MSKHHCNNCGQNYYDDGDLFVFNCPYCGKNYIWSDIKMIFKLFIIFLLILLVVSCGDRAKKSNDLKNNSQMPKQQQTQSNTR